MKFVHACDFHIGAKPESSTPWAKERALSIESSLREVVDLCNKEKADLLLIPGDLFDRPPLRKWLKEAAFTFSLLENTRVVITAGNHDFLSENGMYINYNLGPNVHLISSKELSSIYFQDIQTEVHGLSYYDKSLVQPIYDEAKPSNDGRLHILLAHGGDSKHAPINYSKLSGAGFDYVALGHIHQPKHFENTHIAFCGSPKPLDRTDFGERGCLVGEVTKKSFALKFVPLASSIYRRIDIVANEDMSLGEIEMKIRDEVCRNEKDFFIVNISGLIDSDITIDKEAILPYGKILEVNDLTEPSFDYDTLASEHKSDIISRYINSFDRDIPVQKKALDYGLKVLLKL